jgi:hypothetical protein
VSVPVSFEDNTIVLSAANRTTPLVKTANAVILPEKGVIEAEPGSESIFAGAKLFIAECNSYIGPSDTQGWSFFPAKVGRKGRFLHENGKLYLQMNGKGSVLIFR